MIEDRLSFDDTPGPSPSPVTPQPVTPLPYPVPTPSPKPAAPHWTSTLPWWVILFQWLFIALAAFQAYQLWQSRRTPGPTPNPSPVVINATEAGKAWAKELPLTFADSFEKAQADVRGSDKPLDAIRKEHVERWKAARDAAFNNRFEKAFDGVIAPGNDKPTMEDRRRYAEMMGQIVTGVREGAK